MWNEENGHRLIEMLREMIQLDTTNLPGNERQMTDYIACRLDKAGISYQVFEKEENRSNLIAKLPSTTQEKQKPLILLSHTDVVSAQGEWEQPPFSGNIVDGVMYGRGTVDTKHLTAMELMAMLMLKEENAQRNRDIYLIASADEEKGSHYGMEFLSKEHAQEIPDGYTISEGGGFIITQSGQKYRTCTCGEKGESAVTLTTYGQTCFADCRQSTAYAMLEAMEKIGDYQPQETLCQATRKFREVTGGEYTDPTMKNLWEYSTKDNLVVHAFELDFSDCPDSGRLDLSYKFVPGPEGICGQGGKQAVDAKMAEILGRDADFQILSFEDGYESDMQNEWIVTLSEVSDRFDPGVRMLPMIALGRTDGRFIKKNVYGYSPMLEDQPFSDILKMIHQQNERITLKSLLYGGRVIYETVKSVCAAKDFEKKQDEEELR